MMVKQPIVSVIMSIFNEPLLWLHESIDSILQQTFRDFEFIIICDNPLYEEGLKLLEDYVNKDERIILIHNQQNLGLTKSLNEGLSRARGEYIARMDADDISSPERLQCQYEYMMEHPNVDVCGSNCKLIGDHKFMSDRYYIMPEKHDEIVACMLFKNPLAHPASFFKRIIQEQKVIYDETLKKAQDYKLWHDLYKRGSTFYNIQQCLLYYRISSTQISSTSRTSQNQVSNSIHEEMISELFGIEAKKYIKMHNEICNYEPSEISVDEKLNWLNKLYLYYETLDSHYIMDLLLFMSCQVCFKYKMPQKLLSIKHLKPSVFGKLYFYKGFVLSLFK